MITFIQFLIPNGRQKPIQMHASEEIEKLAEECVQKGALFTAEVLTTEKVSFACEYKVDDEKQDICIEICENGPDVVGAVEKLIRDSHAFINGQPLS